MTELNAVVSIVAAVVLFMAGLKGFATDLQTRGSGVLKAVLGKATRSKTMGFLLGAGVTALVQSSSAVTAITVGLVGSAMIDFQNSLAILLGANVGTTSTAWLVSFKLAGIGPYLLVAGAVLGALPIRAAAFGKSIFFLGFILFSLDLISQAIGPLRDHPVTIELLSLSRNAYLGVLVGAVATGLLQSSSVTIGIGILLTQQGLITAEQVVPIVIGANLGTTVTGLIASASLGRPARQTALANTAFNFAGVLLFLPFLSPFSNAVVSAVGDPSVAVAWAHLIFNLAAAVLGFLILPWVVKFCQKVVP